MDSIKKQTANSGIKNVSALLWCLENLTDRMISVIIQDRLRGGTKRNKKEKGESWIHTIKSENQIKFGANKRINGNWVMKITNILKIFRFSSYDCILIVQSMPDNVFCNA